MLSLILSVILNLVNPPLPHSLPNWTNIEANRTSGWSMIAPSSDTIGIYVSSNIGDDSNNGIWPGPPGYVVGTGFPPNGYIVPPGQGNGPKRTIAAGKAMLRNGKADWLLLKEGDSWNETLGDWNISGKSSKERIVITSYGNGMEPRPTLNIDTQLGLSVNAGVTVNNLAIVGLAFVSNPLNNGGQALQFYGSMNYLLIEDCLLTQGMSEITFNTNPPQRSTNIVIRRNVIDDTWPQNGGGFSAVFLAGVDGILVEENILDQCGHRPGFPPPQGVVLPHTLYSQGGTPANGHYNTGLVIRGNLIARGDGIMDRSDIDIRNNLFLKISIACTIGGTNGDAPTCNPNGITGTAIGNVFLDGYDFVDGNENTPSGFERGWAFTMTNVHSLELGYNIVANNVHGNGPIAFKFAHANDAGNNRGVDGGSIHDNIIYNWGGGHAAWWNNNTVANGMNVPPAQNGVPTIGSLTLTNNQFQYVIPILNIMRFDSSDIRGHITPSHNQYWCVQPTQSWCNEGSDESMLTWMNRIPVDVNSVMMHMAYSNPDVTIGSYFVSTGGSHGITPDGTLENFLMAARLQSRKSWDPKLMPTYNGTIGRGYTYSAGNVNLGPIQYVRQAFGLVVP